MSRELREAEQAHANTIQDLAEYEKTKPELDTSDEKMEKLRNAYNINHNLKRTETCERLLKLMKEIESSKEMEKELLKAKSKLKGNLKAAQMKFDELEQEVQKVKEGQI